MSSDVDLEQVEADRLRAKIEKLRNKIDRATDRNIELNAELNSLIHNMAILTKNAATMDIEVNKSMEYVNKKIKEADIDTSELFALIDDLVNSYFMFKNLSTASKNVTQYTDEYFTKFKYFNELRRISLGYVIGLDAHICSDEVMRKKVENTYLQNTEYWLAYGIMAVMLWATDEEKAAKRAMSKALSKDYLNSSLFFLLINLRFTRINPGKKWYLNYLDRVDTENLGSEWKYLLQAYLCGVFGVDKEFNKLVREYFTNMLLQMETIHPNYGKKVIEKTLNYANTYIHITENEFENLRRNCTEYEELKSLLSAAEKNTVLAINMRKIWEADMELENDMFQRIENILYNLINAYDKEELKVIKAKRYNEMIIRAKGDLGLAKEFFNTEFPSDKTTNTLDDLLFEWAFEEDTNRTDICVKKFALGYLKKWIKKGVIQYGENYRKREKKKYMIAIDSWSLECGENSYEQAKVDLEKYYNNNRIYDMLKDKYVKTFIGMLIASITLLIINCFRFNQISLVIGILLGVIGGFLLWRRVVDMQIILRDKREKGCMLLKNTLMELKAWRELYKIEDEKNSDLIQVFENMEI